MDLQQQDGALESLEQEADEIEVFFSCLDTSRLCMIANLLQRRARLALPGQALEQGTAALTAG